MNKIIPFQNDIKFNTKIYEITSISLENTLSVDENNNIDGEFIVSGEYKMNDSSINTEPFIYGLPFNISLDDRYDQNKLKIDIDDFKFEIVNEEILRVKIDVLLDNLEKIEEEKEEVEEEIKPDYIIEARNEGSDKIINDYINLEVKDMENETDLFKEEVKEPIKVNKEIEENVKSIFDNFDEKDEKYVSYYVHIIRENETIESISSMYNISLDELKKYNILDNITLGSKIIIPAIIDETI